MSGGAEPFAFTFRAAGGASMEVAGEEALRDYVSAELRAAVPEGWEVTHSEAPAGIYEWLFRPTTGEPAQPVAFAPMAAITRLTWSVREPSWTYSDYAVFVSLDALGTGAVAITHSNSDAGPGIRPTTATIVPFYLMVGTPLSEIAATVFAANSPNERGLS